VGSEMVLEFENCDPAIRLITVLSCETQANKWSTDQREKYFNILADCDDTIYASRHYTSE
jgi:uncharacterized phage-like protein YoqJ